MNISDDYLSQFTDFQANCILEAFRRMGFKVKYNLDAARWEIRS